jgi:hypothetical protein
MVGSSFGDLMFGVAYMMEVFAWVWALVAAGVAVAFLRSPTLARRWLYYAVWGLTIGGNVFVYFLGVTHQQPALWWFAMVGAPSEPGVVTDNTNSLNFLTLPLLLFFFAAPLLRKLFHNRAADSSDGTEQ